MEFRGHCLGGKYFPKASGMPRVVGYGYFLESPVQSTEGKETIASEHV